MYHGEMFLNSSKESDMASKFPQAPKLKRLAGASEDGSGSKCTSGRTLIGEPLNEANRRALIIGAGRSPNARQCDVSEELAAVNIEAVRASVSPGTSNVHDPGAIFSIVSTIETAIVRQDASGFGQEERVSVDKCHSLHSAPYWRNTCRRPTPKSSLSSPPFFHAI